MAGDDAPKVFISYAWEDGKHVAWVKEFPTPLRTQDGIDAILDQWVAQPGDDLTHLMEAIVRTRRFALPICTPLCKKKFDDRLGGVGYEARNITGEIQADPANRKVIPI